MLGTGALTIESGATLCGANSSSSQLKNSAIFVRSGGTILAGPTPGAQQGVLYFGGKNVTISEGAFLEFSFYRKASSVVTGGTSIQNIGTLNIDGTIRIYLPEAGLQVNPGDSVVLWKDVKTVTGTPKLETTLIDGAKGLYWDTTDIKRGVLRVISGPTGIDLTTNDERGTTNDLYDLRGRRVDAQPRQGIYIRRGKKVVIK